MKILHQMRIIQLIKKNWLFSLPALTSIILLLFLVTACKTDPKVEPPKTTDPPVVKKERAVKQLKVKKLKLKVEI